PAGIAAVVGAGHVTAPDVDAGFVALGDPGPAAIDRRSSRRVVPVSGNHGNLVSAVHPETSELVEPRSARFARRQIVLMHDQDSHWIATELIRPSPMSNAMRR